MRKGVALLVSLVVLAACTANGPLAPRAAVTPSSSASPSPSPTATAAESPSPSPSTTAVPSPIGVPDWAAHHATCSGAPAASEAVLQLQGASGPILADVADPKAPRTLCVISGSSSFQPQLVTQTMISWYATQGAPDRNGTSVVAILDLFSGTSAIAATWSGGGFLDGLHAWSPDRGFLAYVASDSTGVNLHVLSGGGDRVIATLGPVPARGFNPNEDDGYLAFSPDGAYLAFEQTFTSSGDQLQVRRTIDGSLAFSLSRATMATWGSSGSRLYFRPPGSGLVQAWDSAKGVSQAFGQQLTWIRPRSAVGADTTLAFTVRDSSGTPHTWLYSHDGRSGGQLPNVRSSPVWVSATAFFYVEEAACGANCGIGPAWQPDGKTFTFDTTTQTETSSRIQSVYGSWPRPGQT
jgi:hypothetical protein